MCFGLKICQSVPVHMDLHFLNFMFSSKDFCNALLPEVTSWCIIFWKVLGIQYINVNEIIPFVVFFFFLFSLWRKEGASDWAWNSSERPEAEGYRRFRRAHGTRREGCSGRQGHWPRWAPARLKELESNLFFKGLQYSKFRSINNSFHLNKFHEISLSLSSVFVYCFHIFFSFLINSSASPKLNACRTVLSTVHSIL